MVALKGLGSGELATVAYVGLAAVVYGLTVVVYRYLLNYGADQLKGKNKYITLGIGTFIITWIAALTLMYTILGVH